MRWKRILAGALAGLMVITSVPAAQLGNGTTYAAEIAYKYAEVDSAILQENAIANSEQYPEQGSDGPAEWAFDENDSNWWHSRYDNYEQIGAHSQEEQDLRDTSATAWIGSGFGKAIQLGKITYMARSDDAAGGRIWQYRLYIANVDKSVPAEEDWVLVESKTPDTLENCKTPWGVDEIVLTTPVTATHFKLEAVEMHEGRSTQSEVTAAKIRVYEAERDYLSELKSKIAEAEAYINEKADIYDCTQVQAAVDAAQALVDEDSTDETAIDAAVTALETAMSQKTFSNANGKGVYLSDLDWADGSYTGYGSIEKDKSMDGNTLTLKDGNTGSWTQFAKGVGTHATSEITYDLTGGNYKKFETYVGVDYDGNNAAELKFEIYVDDTLEFESGTMNYETPMVFASVDITNASTLKLRVDKIDDDGGDHADWADARLYTEINEADIDGLKTLIAQAKEKAESDYTGTSWAALQTAIQAAEGVAAKGSAATAKEVEDAKAALEAAIKGLVDRADFSELTAAITAAKEKLEADDIGNYTDESVSALKAKLQEAETLAADSNATQESVNAAANALTEAMNLTLKDADYTAVDAAIAKATSIERDQYTAESLAAFDAAYGAVEVVRGLKVDEQDRVTAMAEAIENALKLLVIDDVKEAKERLQAAITEAEALISQNALYDTSELQAAVEAAKDMLGEESTATAQEIRAQAEVLENGVENFQKVFRNEEGTGVYLSDLEWSSESCGWEGRESQKDRPIKEGTIALWNVDSNSWEQYQKGIGTHADSEITYNLNGAYKKFEAYVGLDYHADEGDYVDGVIFKVYLDEAETPAYESSLMSKYSNREHVSVDVTGVQTMRLVVDKNEDNSGDHADWADAKLYLTLNEADVDGLKTMIAEAKDKKESDYTGTSWASLQAAIQIAEEVAAKGSAATAKEVEDAKAALEAAIEGLVERADFSGLTAAITAAKEKLEADDIGNYTDESVSVLKAKLQEAETLAADSNATQESVNAAANALTEAMNLTLKDADYTAVDAAIAKAASIERDRYTAESLAAFDAAYGAVEVVRGLKVDEQDRVTAMAEAIENALKLLVIDEMKEAKDQLQAVITEAEAFISQNALYDTSELQAAVDAAKAMLGEESTATIQEIKEQAEILKNGVTNFQKVFKNEDGTGVYLSDLEWASESCGWEGRESQKDKSIDGGTIALWNTDSNDWEQFQKGIGTHADSEITYNLNGAYKKFEAYVGMDFYADEGDYVDGVIFKVYLDEAETPAYESPVMSKYANRAYVAVDVAGVQTMRLVVDKNGDNSGDHADWADAKLYATLNGVDITGLNDVIAEAKAKKENDYTGTSWTALQAAIQTAEEVAAKGNAASKEEVEEAKAALKAAIESLVERADFSKLTAAITAAREKLEADDIGNYTEDSVSALRAKLQEAEAVAEDTDAAQKDVDAAAEALNAAMNLTLKDADYTAVDAAIEKAASIERDRYTAESLAAFDAAYEAVEVVRGLKADEQERVTAMAKAIEDALKLLVIDTASDAKEILQEKVNEAKGKAEADYTEASWAALQEAIKRAEEVLSDAEAIRKEVDAALNALQSAVDGLVKRPEEPGEPEQPEEPSNNQPDNAALETLLKNARTKDLSGYTEASANAFRLALAEAEKVLANEKATQAEIDAALKALQTAENGLVKKPAETAKPAAKPIPAVGKVYKVKGMFRGKITKSGATGGTVTIVKLLKKSKSKVVIPATVKINGYSFKVTAVSANAFKNCKKLKSVTIGKNVKTIGKKAFFKCSNLKNITWKGTKAPKIGKQAFKGIQKKCKITVSKKMTKKQLKAFKTRLKKAGIGGKAVYRKK